jgi:predicted nucleic acid-binding protein
VATDFWDTSSIAKLYLNEVGSEWAARRAIEHRVSGSELALAEMASILARRCAEHEFEEAKRDELYSRFLSDAEDWQLAAITESLLRRAASIGLSGILSTRVRALDLIHLASVMEWFERAKASNIEAGAFIVADRPLRAAAEALGLPVDNPEEHE